MHAIYVVKERFLNVRGQLRKLFTPFAFVMGARSLWPRKGCLTFYRTINDEQEKIF